jgi:hypothetical protein
VKVRQLIELLQTADPEAELIMDNVNHPVFQAPFNLEDQPQESRVVIHLEDYQ